MNHLLILLLLIGLESQAQLADTTIIEYGQHSPAMSPTYDVRKLLTTPSGNRPRVYSQESYDNGNTWTSVNFNYETYRLKFDAFDSLSRLVSSTFKKRTTGDWETDKRLMCSYNLSGQVTDTFHQVFQNNAWVDSLHYSAVYNGGQLVSETTVSWNVVQWHNIRKTSYFYNLAGDDSLRLYQTWNGLAWINDIREIFTYDSMPDFASRLVQRWIPSQWDTLSIRTSHFTNGVIDSIFVYDFTGSPFDSLIVFSGDTVRYYAEGFPWDLKRTERLDSAGNIIYYFDIDASGVGYGSGGANYNSANELVYSWYQNSTQGGVISSRNLNYIRPLVNYFDSTVFYGCGHDTFAVTQSTFGGVPPYTFRWTSNGYVSDSLIPDPVISANGSCVFYLTIRDASGNVFHDSIKIISPHQSQFLGTDTVVCVNTSITLNADTGFASYQWSNGDTSPVTTISSSQTGPLPVFLTVSDSTGCTATDTLIITFDACLSVHETQQDQFLVYPNPVTEGFTVKHAKPGFRVEIFDATGKLILEEITDGTTMQFNGSSLQPGVYFVRIINGESTAVTRLIVHR